MSEYLDKDLKRKFGECTENGISQREVSEQWDSPRGRL